LLPRLSFLASEKTVLPDRARGVSQDQQQSKQTESESMDAATAHLETLKDRHQRLEQAINEEQRHLPPDSLKITEMKKEKLVLKERMRQISGA
jgi:hypothetical protein